MNEPNKGAHGTPSFYFCSIIKCYRHVIKLAKAVPHASAPPATVPHMPHQGYPGSGHFPQQAPYNNAPPLYGNPSYPQQYPSHEYGPPQPYGVQQVAPPAYPAPPSVYAAPPAGAYGAPPPAYGAPPHGYAQVPPQGYAQVPPQGYAQAPPHGYVQAPAQGYAYAPRKQKSGFGGGGSGAGMAMGAGAGLLGGLLLGGALDDGPFD